MTRSFLRADPASAAIVDFQSVMVQWLDLQAEMAGLFAQRRVTSPAVAVPATRAQGAESPAIVARGTATQPSGPPPVPHPADERAVDEAPISTRYVVSVRPWPRTGPRASLAPGHVVLVTDDGRGVASAVADRLRRESIRAAIVSIGEGPDARSEVFRTRLDTVQEAERVVRSVRESCGPVAALIHLAPLASAPPFATWDSARWWDHLSRETRALFLLVRALGTSLSDAAGQGGAACLAFTSMGGSFGVDRGETLRPNQGGVTGFLKCVAIENPGIRIRTVDVADGGEIHRLTDQVLDELWAVEACTEVGYHRGQRSTLELEPTPATMDLTFEVPSDGVILATGGARGITAEVCIELAERYQPTFVLVGQNPLPSPIEPPDIAGLTTASDLKRALVQRLQRDGSRPTPAVVERAYRALLKDREIRETISRLSATGARVHYVQVDVQDEHAFGALIDEVYAAYGRIDGVIHGAGIIEDKLVRDKSLESFDRVFRTKVVSAFTLSRRLRPDSLKFLVFFASVAGRFGNRGQADYAAANEVVSKLALRLDRAWPGRVCAIAWAPWDKAGMVSEELKREFARRGVSLLSPKAGRRALWLEIQQRALAPAEVVVAGAGSPSLAPIRSQAEPPLLVRARRTTTAGVVRFDASLDPSVDHYLNDHRLNGRPVLPLAFAAEMMAEAAQAACPALRVFGVRDLTMYKGIVVEASALSLVITVGIPTRSNDGTLNDVEVEITTPSMAPTLRYRSVVQLTSDIGVGPRFDPSEWPLVPMARSLEHAYREWAFHGPLLRRVTGVTGISAEGIVGTIYSSSSSTGIENVRQGDWIIDPFVFDAVLQLFLFWSRSRNDKTALPSRFRSFRCYEPLSDQRLTGYVALQSLSGGHALKGTAHILDATGRVRAVLDGMEASCSRALNRLAFHGVEEESDHGHTSKVHGPAA